MNPERYLQLEPDPYWPDRYETEEGRLRNISGDALRGVFHVGSTAIRRVPGKPALDIIAVYEDEEAMDTAAEIVSRDDSYERVPDSAVIVREEDEFVVIIKMHTPDDEKVRNQLIFRNYLRDSPDARREYAQVKREAMEANADDYEAYTEAKSDVVSSILERAREDRYEKHLPEYV
jgi:GrpB-like predicted nucleotidyltransferase (UPF0157 family)